MNNLKATFSRLLKPKGFFTSKDSAKSAKFPAEFSTKFDIFHYLNFNIPDLQLVKLSLDSGHQEKAFEQFFQYLKMRHTPVFMCNWWKRAEIVQTLKEQYPEAAPNLLKAADNILQHQFLLFGKHIIHTGTPIFWSRSYEEGILHDDKIWEPGQTYSKSKFLADTPGDIRFVWELNRHQHFLDLGKAYWYTGEKEFVQEFINEVSDWIIQNPYPLSVNWSDSYEIALRGLFWIFGQMFFFCSDSVDEEFFCRFYQVLLLHGHAVYDALQTTAKSLKPHHIVAGAALLYLLGTVFPEYIQSKTWSKFGWEILQWESKWLKLEQLVQNSLAALVNVIELYCMVLVVRKNNRYHLPHVIATGLAKMLDQLSLFLKPNGSLAHFGEEQPIQLTRGMYAQSTNFCYLFAMAAILLKKGEFKTLGKRFEEPLLWFFGSQGYQDFGKLETKPFPQQSYIAPNSAYAVMRSGWEPESGYCVVTNNVAETTPDVDLKHTDLLSFELFANENELLVEAGPYSLQKTDDWNQYFRSAYAHNSVTVDRIKYLNFADHTIQSTFDQWVSTPVFDFLSGAHTGFADLEEPVTHRRSFFYLKPHYWIVSDLLTGEGQHFFDQYFHFPPLRINVDFVNKGVNIQVDQSRRFTLMPVSPDEMDVMIFTGGDSPDSGWMSDGYKHRVEAPFIKYGKRTRVPACFHTLLYAYDAETVVPISGRHLHVFAQGVPLLADDVSAIEIALEHEHETQYFAVLYKAHPQIQFDNLTFSGQLLFMRKSGEDILEIILHNATFLSMEDVVLFQSDTPVEGLTLKISEGILVVLCAGNYTFRMQLPQIQQIFVNERKAFLKYDQEMILVSTSRV